MLFFRSHSVHNNKYQIRISTSKRTSEYILTSMCEERFQCERTDVSLTVGWCSVGVCMCVCVPAPACQCMRPNAMVYMFSFVHMRCQNNVSPMFVQNANILIFSVAIETPVQFIGPIFEEIY